MVYLLGRQLPTQVEQSSLSFQSCHDVQTPYDQFELLALLARPVVPANRWVKPSLPKLALVLCVITKNNGTTASTIGWGTIFVWEMVSSMLKYFACNFWLLSDKKCPSVPKIWYVLVPALQAQYPTYHQPISPPQKTLQCLNGQAVPEHAERSLLGCPFYSVPLETHHETKAQHNTTVLRF